MDSSEYKWTHLNAPDATRGGESQEKSYKIPKSLTKSDSGEEAGHLYKAAGIAVLGTLENCQCPKLISSLYLLNNPWNYANSDCETDSILMVNIAQDRCIYMLSML